MYILSSSCTRDVPSSVSHFATQNIHIKYIKENKLTVSGYWFRTETNIEIRIIHKVTQSLLNVRNTSIF